MPEQNYLEKLLKIIQDAYTRYTNSDNKSISTSRDALEIIVDSIYDLDRISVPLKKDGYSSPFLKITKLGKQKDSNNNYIYEEFIISEMQIVRVFGNMVNHPSKFQANKNDQYIVFNYLLRITVWYCERYGLTSYPVYLEAKKHIESIEDGAEQSSDSRNSQYLSDLEFFTNNGYNYLPLLNNKKSVLIVTGSHVIAELLDRPIAEMLREEIHKLSSLRAIIISDNQYLNDAEMHSLSVISVGGTNMNYLTQEIAESGDPSEYEGLKKAYRKVGEINQIALWAENSSIQTRACVERFISAEDGLKKFISSIDGQN